VRRFASSLSASIAAETKSFATSFSRVKMSDDGR
jgi:hypothetical protein